MKCAIEIVSIFNFDMEMESEGYATTFYGELMDGNHEFADEKHVRNFIRKVFPSYTFVEFETYDGLLVASIAEAEAYEYYSTEGMGYAGSYRWYRGE